MVQLRYLEELVTLELDEHACTGCGLCEEVCPHGVFRLEDGRARIVDRGACMECGACALNCPAGALRVAAGVGCATAVLRSRAGTTDRCCGRGGCCEGRASENERG